MKWYETNYVNRRDWVFDHLEFLGLNESQAILVLLIDFMNEKNIPISLEVLGKKASMNIDSVNQNIEALCQKKYLDILASAKEVKFDLSGLYNTDIAKSESVLDTSLFDAFESEFGRTLSSKEMAKIAEWNGHIDRKLILYALRDASAYQHLSLAYIDKILTSWKEKGITVEKIEEGKYE